MPKVFHPCDPPAPADVIPVGRDTPWANPFPPSRHGGRRQALLRYLSHVLESTGMVARIKAELRGRDLACTCGAACCHANVLLAIANDWPLPSDITQMTLDL